jgi:hypothetical protein
MLPPGGGFYPFFPVAPSPVIVVERVVEQRPNDRPLREFEAPPATPGERATPAPVPAPQLPAAPPKTFYVIRGCYAGDRRPLPEDLPAGCDLRRLRVIPPR